MPSTLLLAFAPLLSVPSSHAPTSYALGRVSSTRPPCPAPSPFKPNRALKLAPPLMTASPPPSPSPSPSPIPPTRCGFVTLLGPSNSGKSTLLNRLVGHKVAIVTPKVQTTRCRIMGIAIFDLTQAIFLDTPGIFSPTTRLSRAMVKSAWKSGRDADVVAIVLDIARLHRFFNRTQQQKSDSALFPEDVDDMLRGVLKARERGKVTTLCICANKIDAVPKAQRQQVLSVLSESLQHYGYSPTDIRLFDISAKNGHHVHLFRDWVVSQMPRGPWLYPEDEMTDMPARQLAAEVTREKAFMALSQELPYDIAIETTSYKDLHDGSVRITQDILVARESQKRIVTGHNGSVVKTIGSQSRHELGEILGTKVHLMLTVKVSSRWKDDKWQYQQWGLDFNA